MKALLSLSWFKCYETLVQWLQKSQKNGRWEINDVLKTIPVDIKSCENEWQNLEPYRPEVYKSLGYLERVRMDRLKFIFLLQQM